MKSKIKIIVLVLAVTLLTSSFKLRSTVVKAGDSPRIIIVPDDFPTIKQAIDNATEGDTVFVRAGTHNLTEEGHSAELGFVSLTITKSISLIGESCQNTVLLAEDDFPSPWGGGIVVRADCVAISGFKIISNRNVINLMGNNSVLTNNIIRLTGHLVAITTESADTISSNIMEGEGYGVGIYAGTNAVVFNNTVRNFDVGITSYSFCYNQSILQNTIVNNTIGLQLLTVPAVIYHNNIENSSQYSITVGTSGKVNATYNYWGTTDQSVIANSIYDNKNDSSLGPVNFKPFLSEPFREQSSQPASSILQENSLILVSLAAFIGIAIGGAFCFKKSRAHSKH
jgi:hypothetical protein